MKLFEVAMLLCFGAAWPFSIAKSAKARTTAGKSPIFLAVLLAGYICGIINKAINGLDYVVIFYIINLLMVTTDLLLYIRNRRLEKAESK